ncbi:MAG: peptidoglycan recognition family protein [Mobilitalea sp.]
MGHILSHEEWFERKRIQMIRRNKRRRCIVLLFLIVIAAVVISLVVKIRPFGKVMSALGENRLIEEIIGETLEVTIGETLEVPLADGTPVDLQYLTPNEFSRPQTKMEKVNAIVIHYTGNPGTTAQANRNFFEELGETGVTSASSHFVIGLEGEIIQCIPLSEISYASNDRNFDTISIECCHPDESGQFKEETYHSLVALAANLYVEFDLSEEDLLRHYDVTGKYCPLYYVKNEDAWELMKEDILREVEVLKINVSTENN